MDDPRFSICRYGGGSRLAGDDPRATARAAAGDRVRLDHAGLQHALHLLHRAAHARRGAEPHDRRDRARGARTRRARREGSHAARPDRESLRAARVPEDRRQEPVRAVARSRARDRRPASGCASPRRIRSAFATISIAGARASCRSSRSTCICRCNPARTASSRRCIGRTRPRNILRSSSASAPRGRTSRSPPNDRRLSRRGRERLRADARARRADRSSTTRSSSATRPRAGTPAATARGSGAGARERRAQPGSARASSINPRIARTSASSAATSRFSAKARAGRTPRA